MQKKIMDTNINFTFTDNKKEITLVLLHGWGQNIEMMEPIAKPYKNHFNILIIDLPGFGKSSEPPFPWTIYDYVECIHKLVDELKIRKVILIGHSFGGRLSLIYSSKYKVEKLICLASPYIKEMKKLPLKTKIYKTLKKVIFLRPLANIMKNFIGSTDYKNASEIMRGVMVQSINVDMTEEVKNIKCPTLLIWGTLDTAVPISRAYELEKLIPDSGVVVYEGATHYAYLERLSDVIRVLDSFFNIRR